MNAANTDLDGTAALCEEQGVVAKAAIAKKALPNCNIVCLTGEELKADVSGYLQVLYDATRRRGRYAARRGLLLDSPVTA